MRAERTGIAVWIHRAVVEIIVAHGIRTQFRIVLFGRQHQRRAAAPTPHEFRGQQLLPLGTFGVLLQVVAKDSDMLLQPAVRHVAAVA